MTLFRKQTLIQQHERIKQGDIKAFEMLFKDQYTPLCQVANAIVNDIDAAEEIVQEFFFQYWKERENLTIKTSLQSYMYKSIRNSALNYLDRVSVRRRYVEHIQSQPVHAAPAAPIEEMHAKELRKLIDNTLQHLPERCRNIFLMNRFEGLTYLEIAEKLSVSVKTVEANMSKALNALRKTIQNQNQ